MGKRRLPYDTTVVSLEELDIGSSDFGLDPDRFADDAAIERRALRLELQDAAWLADDGKGQRRSLRGRATEFIRRVLSRRR